VAKVMSIARTGTFVGAAASCDRVARLMDRDHPLRRVPGQQMILGGRAHVHMISSM
jgi:hypothetical protein